MILRCFLVKHMIFCLFCMSLHRVNMGDFICLATYLISQATQWVFLKFGSDIHTKSCQVDLILVHIR